jgi:hypothetical protein
VGDVDALQVVLHQLVGVLGDLVHELVAVLLGLLAQVVGDLDLLGVVLGVALVFVRLHVDEVDDATDLVLRADRDLGGHGVRAEGLLELVEAAEEVGSLAVEHVHEDEAGQPELRGALPEALGADLDAHHAVDDENRALAYPQGGHGVGQEAGLAGRVDQVDLAVLP